MHQVAQQKLNAEASTYAEAWNWASTQLEFTWMDQQRHLRAAADMRAAFTDEETEALNAAEAAIEEASEALDDPGLDGDRRRELWATITREQKRYADIERARADRDEYSEAVRAQSGVVVALDRDGNLDIHRGLVRAEDADAYRAATRPADAELVEGNTWGDRYWGRVGGEGRNRLGITLMRIRGDIRRRAVPAMDAQHRDWLDRQCPRARGEPCGSATCARRGAWRDGPRTGPSCIPLEILEWLDRTPTAPVSG